MPIDDVMMNRSTGAGARDSGSAVPSRARQSLALVTLCLAVLIAQLDTSVVNLAVRPIGEYFHAGLGALQWVVDSYNLVYAILLLSGGLLADLYGRRRVFMAGAAVFTAASVCTAPGSLDTSLLLSGGRHDGLVPGCSGITGTAQTILFDEPFGVVTGDEVADASRTSSMVW